MHIDSATHSLWNCYLPASLLREFQFYSATRVYASLRNITHLGYDREKNNSRRTWRALGAGTHSYFRTVRYTRGTLEAITPELLQIQRETMVPGVGVEPTMPLMKRKLLILR